MLGLLLKMDEGTNVGQHVATVIESELVFPRDHGRAWNPIGNDRQKLFIGFT